MSLQCSHRSVIPVVIDQMMCWKEIGDRRRDIHILCYGRKIFGSERQLELDGEGQGGRVPVLTISALDESLIFYIRFIMLSAACSLT
jgi:hypothetical protein